MVNAAEKRRAALAAKLLAIVEWMDACPRGRQDRMLEIEIGVDAKVRASVRLHANWLCRDDRGDSDRLGSRTYYEEGRSVADAVHGLRLPHARPRKRGRRG